MNLKKCSLIAILSTGLSFGLNAASGLPSAISELVESAAPAVVNITSKKEVKMRNNPRGFDEFERFFGIPRNYPQPQEPQTREAVSYGSGFIFKEGYLLTNFHVIDEATEIIVSLNDRREYSAEVVGIDPLSDLAVLKISGKNLPKVSIGDSENLKVGDWVVAIGSPFSFDFSVTAGIVSAKGRSIQNQNIGNYVPFIQTDVAINPGNSGGPLFDLDGKVVGINSQIYSRSGGYQGLAFAIPIDVAMEVAEQIIATGNVARGYLGVRVGEVDNDLAEALSMDKPYGALITDVEKGESGADAGLQPGDVILEFDGREIKFGSDLPHVVGRIQPKSKANAKVIRDGKTITLKFVLGELPTDQRTFIPAKTEISSDPLGLKIEDLSAENSKQNDPEEGVLVTRVNNGSPASGKITKGDIITEVIAKGKRYEIEDATSFESLVAKFSTGDKLAIVGRRNGNRFFVAVTVN
ncbi:Do family serine endopeptidase [Gammaproteobacteria bacterium]|nr:Do family serine endopeptidase [Gammaproteobacteria bacterium]